MDGLDKRTLGRNIRQARRRLGLTQEQMAARLDMSPEEYARMEQGLEVPRLERFVAVCRILGETPDQLTTQDNDEEAEVAPHLTLVPEEPMNTLKMTLAINIREARKSLGLTQEEMAELIHMPLEKYARMERGGLLPSLDSFVAMCRVLGDTSPQLLMPRPRKRR